MIKLHGARLLFRLEGKNLLLGALIGRKGCFKAISARPSSHERHGGHCQGLSMRKVQATAYLERSAHVRKHVRARYADAEVSRFCTSRSGGVCARSVVYTFL